MIKRMILPLLLLTLTSPFMAQASEKLHYRLSYSGLITGFFWKKLADVTLNIKPEAINFRGENACRLTMTVDTSAYLFAEIIHPVRYHWDSILSPDLQYTLLTRAIDNGTSDIHEVAWYDWKSTAISIYRKRKEVDLNRNIYRAEEKMAWEKNSYAPPPTFIDPQPLLENGLNHLIQTGEFKRLLAEPAIDPLAMIRRVRHHRFEQFGALQMVIALDEKLHHYQAKVLEQTSLRQSDKLHSTLKIGVSRTAEGGRKGAMYFWLSNDSRRLPLRIDIKARLGMIHMELLNTEEGLKVEECPSYQPASSDS